MTTITTTAELWGHEMRIEQLNKLASHFQDDIVEIKSSAGTHRYIYQNRNWQPIVK